MVNTNLKHLVLAATVLLGPTKPSVVYTGRTAVRPGGLVDHLYRTRTLPKKGVEFIVCTQGNKMYIPEQEASEDDISYDLCELPYNGTIHSHPTHLDDYLCEPSDYDTDEFLKGTDTYMGIACYDNKSGKVYVNNYDKR